MKLKVDFVTNSSSSSFVVMGTSIDPATIPIEIIENHNITPDQMSDDPYEVMEILLNGTDLSHSFGCDYYNRIVNIGIEYTKMKDDETLEEFKQRIRQQIKDTLGIDANMAHIEKCWMDN